MSRSHKLNEYVRIFYTFHKMYSIYLINLSFNHFKTGVMFFEECHFVALRYIIKRLLIDYRCCTLTLKVCILLTDYCGISGIYEYMTCLSSFYEAKSKI